MKTKISSYKPTQHSKLDDFFKSMEKSHKTVRPTHMKMPKSQKFEDFGMPITPNMKPPKPKARRAPVEMDL